MEHARAAQKTGEHYAERITLPATPVVYVPCVSMANGGLRAV